MKQVKWEELVAKEDIAACRSFFRVLMRGEKRYLLQNDILLAWETYRKSIRKKDPGVLLDRFVRKLQEVILLDDCLIVILRYRMARDRIYRISTEGKRLGGIGEIPVGDLLDIRDRFILNGGESCGNKLKIDFTPFYDYSPLIRDPKNVGRGMEFLNRHMSSSIFQHPGRWHKILFEFLKIHSLEGRPLLVDGTRISDESAFLAALDRAVEYLDAVDPALDVREVQGVLNSFGFEPGWGNTSARVLESMRLLLDLFEAPDSRTLEEFISRIPMISTAAVISPHGFFGQENVLGKPDTGGQVVYILDQVRAMEKRFAEDLRLAGLAIEPKILIVTRLIPQSENTTCHVRLEKIKRTRNCWILRVPFRDRDGRVVDYWISRFWVWPYLERFTYEVLEEIRTELGRNPDLIIGNYSDGGLVASLLSEETGVIQCNIAHALEKSKYLFSDLYWQEMEPEYHFSLQFTADLLAMNMADFIITSTIREIAGTAFVRGQYEAYQHFTLPGFCQVLGGVNLFHPKFNVISPGVDEEIFFPCFEQERRNEEKTRLLRHLLLEKEGDGIYGTLEDPKRIPLFTMARLDKIKNVTGLVECFGKFSELHERCNLIVVAGRVDEAQTEDPEEREEIRRMHELIGRYGLSGKIRWIGMQFPREDTGEIYRIIADGRGIFVQPALFEAFGLTVLEAMASGLPVFATQFGGPSEIIQHGVSGFLINPTRHDLVRDQLVAFLDKGGEGPLTWDHLSRNAVKRVRERFTWGHYNDRLLELTKLYGFWRFAVSNREKRKMKLYSQTLFHLLFKRRAEEMS